MRGGRSWVSRAGAGSKRVRLADGETVPADVVVVGIGVIPETGWLASSGLAIDNGVVCDATLATAHPASWRRATSPGGPMCFSGRPCESSTGRTPSSKGRRPPAGCSSARTRRRRSPRSLRLVRPVRDQDPDSGPNQARRRGAARARLLRGRTVRGCDGAGRPLVGALVFNEPRQLMGWRQHIEARSSWAEALSQADTYESQ